MPDTIGCTLRRGRLTPFGLTLPIEMTIQTPRIFYRRELRLKLRCVVSSTQANILIRLLLLRGVESSTARATAQAAANSSLATYPQATWLPLAAISCRGRGGLSSGMLLRACFVEQ